MTTGIGSLPHHNVDAALEFSLRMDLPFLPQIPIRNPWEYMIAQALEGLPGLEADREGNVSLNVPIWESRTAAFKRQLEDSFASAESAQAFDRFELHPSVASGWQGFLFELEERGVKRAKIQTAGPMTAQWALRMKEEGGATDNRPTSVPGLASQIYRLVLARTIASVRRLKAIGVAPVVYLDEPGLYGLSLENPKHILGISELKIMIQTLTREGAQVGLHCCSNTDWDVLLNLAEAGLGILSLDAGLSLANLLSNGRAPRVARFIERGAILSLGVIPTARSAALRSMKPETLVNELLQTLEQAWPDDPAIQRSILSTAIYTPACGLAFHSVDDAEHVLEALTEVRDRIAAQEAGPR
jgi:hypothetical protein